ncbi:MAG: TolC family protein [Opitutae bacterium]|nr:TolC family protein [Opitutae bacterium]
MLNRSLSRSILSLCAVFLSVGVTLAADDNFSAYRTEEVFPQLKPILEKAMAQSPQVLLRALDINQAEAAYVMTRSSLLPRLDASYYYSTNTTAVSDVRDVKSRSDGLFYNISVSQPLFQWGTLKAQTDSARIGVKIAEKNFAEAYRLLAVTIRQQYGVLILRKAGLKLAAESLRLSQENLAVDEERLRTGRISPGDIIGPRLAVDEARINLERSESDLLAAKRAFSRFTGQAVIDDESIPETMPVDPHYYSIDRATPVLDLFTAAGIDDMLPLQVIQAQIKQADLNYKVAKFRLFPKISVSANISQANQTNASATAVSQVGVESRNLNVMAVWSIFDGFATTGAKRSALSSKRSSERQLEMMRQIYSDQARDLERQIRYSARTVQLYDTRRALSEDAVKRTRDNLQRGLNTQKDVDAANINFLSSDFSALQQRLDLLNKWTEFLSLTGSDNALKILPARYLNAK